MKKRLIIIALILVTIVIIYLINPLLLIRNKKVINHLDSLQSKEYITRKDLIPFEYDKLHIIYPYTPKEFTEKEIGIKSRFIKENNNDNHYDLLIIKNNKIISNPSISINISIQLLGKEEKNTRIRVLKTEEGYSFIEQFITYEDTFYDIKFTLPGSYWKEDNEDIRMYYLDIASEDYLTIEQKDKINKKNYQKIEENIFFKEDTIEYVTYINKKYYIFKTNTINNKEETLKIVKSITKKWPSWKICDFML